MVQKIAGVKVRGEVVRRSVDRRDEDGVPIQDEKNGGKVDTEMLDRHGVLSEGTVLFI